MWYLKYRFRHSDCIYTPKLKQLGLTVFFYHLGSYIKGKYVFTSSLQQIQGSDKNFAKYKYYLSKHPDIIILENYGNVLFALAKHKSALKIYETIYNPIFLYPTPAHLDNDGFEIVEIACWEKKPLQNLIESFRKNKTTEYFEILKFVNRKMEDIYVTRLLPKLAPKQHESIILAFKYGFYQFPRKINLDKLAKIAGVSKPTFRENLKKAEAKLMPLLIPK